MQRKNEFDRTNDQANIDFNGHKYNKTMILIKSSVFALFIVLVVMIAAFMIAKSRKDHEPTAAITSSPRKCDKVKSFKLPDEIEQVSSSDGVITILTKIKSDKQEVIRIDECGRELNRFIFNIV